MRRREFIAGLGGTAAGWPLAVRAQQPALPVIGFLCSESVHLFGYQLAAFHRGLSEGGYVDGREIVGALPKLAEKAVALLGKPGYLQLPWSLASSSSRSTPLRPTGATIPNSAKSARIELIIAVCWRMNRCRVR
jgi:hypothetical protein